MKTILVGVLLVSICFGVFTFGVLQHKEMAAETALKAAAWWVLGIWPEVGDFKLDLGKHRIEIKDLKIRNPAGFPPEDKWMIQISEIDLVYNPESFARKKILLKELGVFIKEVTIVRNENKEVNAEALKIVREGRKNAERRAKDPGKIPSQKKEAEFPWKIDRLHLSVDWVVYKDYTQGKLPFVQETPRVFDEIFHNVADPDQLRRDIIAKTIVVRTANVFAQYQLGLFAPVSPQILSPQAKEGSKIMEELVRILLPFEERSKRSR